MAKHAYSVTYTTADGKVQTAVVYGCSHAEIERKISAIGGQIEELTHADDDIIIKARSWKRTALCWLIFIIIGALVVAFHWYRVAK